jgi:hypothetical protein
MRQDNITTPMEAFDAGVFRGTFIDKYSWGKNRKPGAVIFDMNDELRELLKELKSDDIANIRPDYIFGTPERQKELEEINKYYQRQRDGKKRQT